MQGAGSLTDLRQWMHLAAFALVYGLLSEICVRFLSLNGLISVVWLPAGLALAAILVRGPQVALGVLAGDLLFIWLRGEPLALAALIAAGNTLAAWLGARLLTAAPRFDLLMRSLRDYGMLVLAGAVSCGVSALLGVGGLRYFERIQDDELTQSFVNWWAGDAIGVLLMAPLLLIWRVRPRDWSRPAHVQHALVLLAVALVIGQAVFFGWFTDFLWLAGEPYWLFVVMAVCTPRLWRHGVTAMAMLFAVQGLAGVVSGTGMFAGDGEAERLARYWSYIGALSVFGMVSATHFERLQRVQVRSQEQEDTYRSQFSDNSAVMLLFELDGQLIDANEAAVRFYGFKKDVLLRQNLYKLSLRTTAEVRDTLESVPTSGGGRFESQHRLADGTVRDVVVSNSPVRMGERHAMHSIVFDITDRKRAEAEIENLAFFDPLTRLPNRRLLMDRLEKALPAALRSRTQGALLFIDLDNFKTLNDSHGHERGDTMLHQTGQRLVKCVRAGDTVARLGGDEFVIMLKDLSAQGSVAAAQVKAVGAKVLAALKEPYELDGVVHHGSCSVGMAMFGLGGETSEELFKRADMALYEAKGAGRNMARFFDPAMQAAMVERSALEHDLRRAVEAGEFVLHYQAQVNAAGQVTGAEALLRWQHPKLGKVLPGTFVTLAEDTGLILPIGTWVLEQACRQLVAWAAHPATADLTISVNVSARQFHQESFFADLVALLETSGAPPGRLKLELTESLLVRDVDDIVEKMAQLQQRGVRFSLDDFGTGYSSLAYLKRLPLDQIKIDQAFVRDLLVDPNDAAIARTIIALGNALGLQVMAEGVESQAQRDFLWQQGCFHYQGYHFGWPGPVADLENLVRESASKQPA